MASDDFSGFLFPTFFENHSIAFHFEKAGLIHPAENGLGFDILSCLQKVIHVRDALFSKRPDEFEEFIHPVLFDPLTAPHILRCGPLFFSDSLFMVYPVRKPRL
jgi:hypothetical protein